MFSVCYISHRTSNCPTDDKNTTNYDSPLLMDSDKINSLKRSLFGGISNSRNMFGNPFIIHIFLLNHIVHRDQL